MFSSLSQLWYVEVRISRSVSVSPLEFQITGVNCNFKLTLCTLNIQTETDMLKKNSVDVHPTEIQKVVEYQTFSIGSKLYRLDVYTDPGF